ncbi:unnamed protein product [Calypogeia fissa]
MSFEALMSVIDTVELHNTIVLTFANPAYALFLDNWDCYAKPLIGRHFLVYTNDYDFGRLISERDGYHVLVHNSTNLDDLKHNLDFGTVEYQRLILARTKLVAQLLDIGKNVLIADNDAVWLSNPLPYLIDNNVDIISTQEDTGREYQNGPGDMLCGGFLFLNHTPTTKRVWSEVTERHEELVARAIANGELAFFGESEQTVINSIMRAEQDASFVANDTVDGIEPLRIHLLDTLLFPNGRLFFEYELPQSENVRPVVVHNNWLVGYESKLKRFRRFGLWRVAAANDTARPDVDEGGGHRCTARNLAMEGIDAR